MMKRRSLVMVPVGMAGSMISGLSSAAQPCPPPRVSVIGGTSITTTCPTVAGATYSTSFQATENPLSEGGAWINGKLNGTYWNNIQSANGRAGATHIMSSAPPYDDCIAHINAAHIQFGANQYAQGTVFRANNYTAGHEIELLVRFGITAGFARGYEVYWSTNGGLYVVRWNGPINDFSPLVTANVGIARTGDILRVEAVGTNIVVKINGSAVLTCNDNRWATGQPGIGLNPYDPGSDFYSYTWDDFSCGSL